MSSRAALCEAERNVDTNKLFVSDKQLVDTESNKSNTRML